MIQVSLKYGNLKWYDIKVHLFLSERPYNSSFMIYVVHLLTRKCETVWLPLDVNELIYWRYVLEGHFEREFRRLIIDFILVPKIYNI